MSHHVLTGVVTALALVGSADAQAQQIYFYGPGPVYSAPAPYSGGAVVVVPSPYAVPTPYAVPGDAYAYVPPPGGYVTVPQAGVYATVPQPDVYATVPQPGFYATSATVVDPRTGRRCTIEPSGYRWCWTP